MSVDKLKKAMCGVLAVALYLASGTVFAALTDMPLNLTRGVTETSQRVYDLHMIILYIVTVIGIIVFGVMCWSIFHHRKSKGAVAAQFHHSTTAEIIWTIIPIIILVAMAVPATKTLVFMEQTSDAEMTLKVTGYQWKWRYDYLEEGVTIWSALHEDSNKARQRDPSIDPETVENYLLEVDNPIVLPVDTKIRILTTADDVIHAWWVPALGWKRDAIPGFITDNWTNIKEPGIYRGQCAELCGRDHAFMPIVVHAVPKAEYVAWIETQKAEQAASAASANKTFTKDELMRKGEQIYTTQCAACHQAEGQGIEGVFPSLVGGAIATGPAADHIDIVLNGKNLMPAFKEQLNDAELAAVITFERNKWGNYEKITAKGHADVVQPADVKATR